MDPYAILFDYAEEAASLQQIAMERVRSVVTYIEHFQDITVGPFIVTQPLCPLTLERT